MFSPELLSAFKTKIDAAKTIAIFGHENVDGDAVGSMLGRGKLLEKLGKTVGYFTTLPPAKSYQFLPDIAVIHTDFNYNDRRDLIIFVDFHEYKRIGKITAGHESYFDSRDLVIIDHHIGEGFPPHALVLKEPEAASTTELLYEIAKQSFPQAIDAHIATYFYLGIVTDTGNFQYETDTARTMTNAIGLIRDGAKKSRLIQHIFNSNDRTSIDLLKMVIPRITREGNLCYVRYTSAEIEALGFDKDEADILIFSNIKPIKDIPVFAIIRGGNDGQAGLSLRSGYMANGKRINVQTIAAKLGGGGHIYAAGCKQPITKAFEKQVPELAALLNEEIAKQL